MFELIDRRLAAAPTVVAAAEVAMEACLEEGYELPSVYLERGGRLRCLAQRGYWQVFDGLAPGAGVLGTAYQQGRTQVVHDPGKSEDYIAAIPTVVSEVCVPLMIDGQPAGAFNVESRTPLGDADVAWIESMAQALSRRIAELGRPLENQAEMLARFAYELASLDDRDRVLRHTLTAAVTVSGMRGACLFLDPHRPGRCGGGLGPAGPDAREARRGGRAAARGLRLPRHLELRGRRERGRGLRCHPRAPRQRRGLAGRAGPRGARPP